MRAGRLSFLRVTIVAVMLAFFLSIFAGSARAQSSYDAEELDFLRSINAYRENKGFPP